MAHCIAIIGKDGSPLFFQVSGTDKEKALELETFVDCSLDIVDEKINQRKIQELYLGPLINNYNYKSFGFITNTHIKFVLVTDIFNTSLTDQDIRAIFKKLHTAFCNVLHDPFYVPGDPIKSKYMSRFVTELLRR
uniref:Trafficking protein particle complex subunit 2-like protein n=1 Tax=Steinernema glaseri TaxID=37863 RepID=A0A1I7ZGS1_9BILA